MVQDGVKLVASEEISLHNIANPENGMNFYIHVVVLWCVVIGCLMSSLPFPVFQCCTLKKVREPGNGSYIYLTSCSNF